MIKSKGFTLIELITVISIISIISVSGAYLMVYFVQNSVVIPNKLNMDMIISEALDIMIEGNSLAKGLRFSKSIIEMEDNRVVFDNQEGERIVYRLDTIGKKLYRSINGSSETFIPYYVKSGINIIARNGSLFTYRNQGDNEIDTGGGNPADIRRIEIGLIAKTGTGSYADWEARSEQISSIAIKKFQ